MNQVALYESRLMEAVGESGELVVRTWTEKDVMLYHLSVGAGQRDAGEELNLTTENSPETDLQVLASFACTLSSAPWPEKFAPDMTKVVHVTETIKLTAPIPTSGTCTAQMTITGTTAHRAGTVFNCKYLVCDYESKQEIATVEMGLLVRDVYIGDAPNDTTSWAPVGEPHQISSMQTAVNQALVYRLNGDRNPLHSSPQFAQKAGFERPILHGLCTLGISTRLLVDHYSTQDAGAVTSIRGVFKKPVFPGDTLMVESWKSNREILFRTLNQDRKVVLDQGQIELKL